MTTRRVAAYALPLLGGAALPLPADALPAIFRYDPVNPRAGRTYTWVPRDVQAVLVEITNPAGRTTLQTWEAV
jgi:hypothetical protein